MLCGIHYFITTLKTKIDVIILSRFKLCDNVNLDQHSLSIEIVLSLVRLALYIIVARLPYTS